MQEDNFGIKGLSDEEVKASRAARGSNTFVYKKEYGWVVSLRSLVKEPMVILLLLASFIYLMSGKTGDALFMAGAIVFVATISLYQDSRSRNALEKLKKFTQPGCTVLRNGITQTIKTEELVVGDCIIVEEGTSVPADAIILHSNDFSVNESVLTGESMPVFKDAEGEDACIFQGTTVSGGLAIARITAIGNATRLGKLGESLESIQEEKTPLEKQINNFVQKMVIAGGVVFIIVWGMNYRSSHNILDSLLKALTLAMSILPEEIPVAFTTFMALGAWRLMKMGIVVKQMKTVETLGSATVFCTDKTGTITENRMTLAKIYVKDDRQISTPGSELSNPAKELIRLAMWASEPIPYDPMEKALHEAYVTSAIEDERPFFRMVHEYPLEGKPPMMTHIYENKQKDRIIAMKGAPEALLPLSDLAEETLQEIRSTVQELGNKGYRILGVGEANFTGHDYPRCQQDFTLSFKGLVAFHDPPKENIQRVLEGFYQAGITVKIVTGDHASTTAAIAGDIGFRDADKNTGSFEVMNLGDAELQQCVTEVHVYTRMHPEAKLRVINALKANREVVAMTGDGVNDGPALKAAHIGIAMGMKGTEIAKQAASLILLNDDLSAMLDAVAMGRRIYANLKKAIRYIISIHIPIVLTVFIPLAFAWMYPNIFTPVHIIFLELIMGPTCSILYENEPMEANTMMQKPRPYSETFFNARELLTSVIQGLAITAGVLLTYQWAVNSGCNEAHTRTLTFLVLVASNIFLTLVNRSFYFSVFTTLRYKNDLVVWMLGITVVTTAMLIYYPPLTHFFAFDPLSVQETAGGIFVGFLSVIWFELVKWQFRYRADKAG